MLGLSFTRFACPIVHQRCQTSRGFGVPLRQLLPVHPVRGRAHKLPGASTSTLRCYISSHHTIPVRGAGSRTAPGASIHTPHRGVDGTSIGGQVAPQSRSAHNLRTRRDYQGVLWDKRGSCHATEVSNGCIGRPFGARVYVAKPENPHLRLPRGFVGEIIVEGSGVSVGYVKSPAATAKAFVEDLP